MAPATSNGAALLGVCSCQFLLNHTTCPLPPSPYHLGLQSCWGGRPPLSPLAQPPPLSPTKMTCYELALILKATHRVSGWLQLGVVGRELCPLASLSFSPPVLSSHLLALSWPPLGPCVSPASNLKPCLPLRLHLLPLALHVHPFQS